MRSVDGWAVREAGGAVAPWRFERRELRSEDVAIHITHYGICGSDLGASAGGPVEPTTPLVTGHEIAGVITALGASVTGFTIGDAVLVGTIIDSCRSCPPCLAGEESYCVQGVTTTYGGRDRVDDTVTQGGWSSEYVADMRFVYHLPSSISPEAAAPLMCAGATTWSPLMHWEADPQTTVGVVGLGGLGHMAVKWAHALGAETVLFTTSADKAAEGRRLGADDVVLSHDEDSMRRSSNQLNLILDTAAGAHSLDPYLRTPQLNGVLCQLGLLGKMIEIEHMSLLLNRRSLTGSAVCGTVDPQRMLDFAANKSVAPEVEVLPIDQVNGALDRSSKNEVHYRLVLATPTGT